MTKSRNAKRGAQLSCLCSLFLVRRSPSLWLRPPFMQLCTSGTYQLSLGCSSCHSHQSLVDFTCQVFLIPPVLFSFSTIHGQNKNLKILKVQRAHGKRWKKVFFPSINTKSHKTRSNHCLLFLIYCSRKLQCAYKHFNVGWELRWPKKGRDSHPRKQ